MNTGYAATQVDSNTDTTQMASDASITSQQGLTQQALWFGIFIGLITAVTIACLIAFSLHKKPLLLLDGVLLLSLIVAVQALSEITTSYIWSGPSALIFHMFSAIVVSLCAFIASKNQELSFYQPRLLQLFKGLAIVSLLAIPLPLLFSLQASLYVLTVLVTLSLSSHLFCFLLQWQNKLQQRGNLDLSLLFTLLCLLLVSCETAGLFNTAISALILLQLSILIYAGLILTELMSRSQTDEANLAVSADETEDKDLKLSGQMLELQFALKELQEKNEQLEKLNTLDELSGIHNRRHFDKRLQAELRRCRRELAPLSLIMFDIDHFKKFNDSYGHIAGDEVIRTVALTASQQLNRDADEIFRYGGEEYAIILPNTDLQGALFLAEKVRQAIAATQINNNEQVLSCTISLGVCCHLSQQAIQPKDFIERADKALYQSKQNGRNQVAHYNQ